MKTHPASHRKSGTPKAKLASRRHRGGDSVPEVPAKPDVSAPLDILSATELETPEGTPSDRPIELTPVRFGYFQPNAREVFLAGTFNGWDPAATPMHRDSVGDWSVELALSPGEYRYRFFVDGEWCDDPQARQTVTNPFGGFDAVIEV